MTRLIVTLITKWSIVEMIKAGRQLIDPHWKQKRWKKTEFEKRKLDNWIFIRKTMHLVVSVWELSWISESQFYIKRVVMESIVKLKYSSLKVTLKQSLLFILPSSYQEMVLINCRFIWHKTTQTKISSDRPSIKIVQIDQSQIKFIVK